MSSTFRDAAVEWHFHGRTDKQTGRWTDPQIGKQAGRQVGRQKFSVNLSTNDGMQLNITHGHITSRASVIDIQSRCRRHRRRSLTLPATLPATLPRGSIASNMSIHCCFGCWPLRVVFGCAALVIACNANQAANRFMDAAMASMRLMVRQNGLDSLQAHAFKVTVKTAGNYGSWSTVGLRPLSESATILRTKCYPKHIIRYHSEVLCDLCLDHCLLPFFTPCCHERKHCPIFNIQFFNH